MNLCDNQITNIPLQLFHLTNLIEFHYIGNPLGYIPENIERWLNRFYFRLTKNNNIYNDHQNIHNTNIQKSFRNSLSNIIKDLLNIEFIKEDLINNKILNQQSKREIFNYFEDNTLHSIYLISYQELFQYVYSRIYKHQNKNDILQILNQEIKDGLCMCFTGRLTRLLNVLVGYYDDIEIQISDNEQITNIILNLRKKYKGNELKEFIIKELTDRDYNNDIINEWISYI